MTVTKYTMVELDPIKEVDEIMALLKDSLNTDKETRFRCIRSTGTWTVFVKAELVDLSIGDLIEKE